MTFIGLPCIGYQRARVRLSGNYGSVYEPIEHPRIDRTLSSLAGLVASCRGRLRRH